MFSLWESSLCGSARICASAASSAVSRASDWDSRISATELPVCRLRSSPHSSLRESYLVKTWVESASAVSVAGELWSSAIRKTARTIVGTRRHQHRSRHSASNQHTRVWGSRAYGHFARMGSRPAHVHVDETLASTGEERVAVGECRRKVCLFHAGDTSLSS